METPFLQGTLGRFGTPVCRIGLSATYRPGRQTLDRALDEGINYLFFYGFDSQMIAVIRDRLRSRREEYVLATGAYNLLVTHTNLRRTLEKRLRQTGAGYIDLFHFLGIMKPEHLTPKVREEMQAVRESGLVRGLSVSCHDRKFAAQLAREGVVDAVMIRYNAAHRGAEKEIFPCLGDRDPAVISYTATRWGYLLRPPKGYPKDGPVPTAGQCYRFVLSNPAVNVCLMAPSNMRHLEANLAEIRNGPLSQSEMTFMREFGDIVYNQKKYFM